MSTRQGLAPASKTGQTSQTMPTVRSDNCLAPEHADRMSNKPRAGPPAATRSADALTSSDAANLGKIDHVVVVMLENRSFDHMLGYLSTGGRRSTACGRV